MQNEVFYDPAAYTSRSPHTVGERRYVTVGLMRGALVAVISTHRGHAIRIISARRHGAVRGSDMARRLKARRAEKAANEERPGEHIVRHVASLGDGTYIIEHPDGRLERRKSETDWASLEAMTDEEIDASIANDPDWEEFKDIDWSKAILVIPPKKKAISIRVDEDVLDYFKKQGAGYQRRMNAVLRSYMQQKRRKRA